VYVALYAKHQAITGPTLNEIHIYDADSSSWETVGSMTYNVWTWVNVTVDLGYAVDDKILVRLYMENAISSASAYVDYAEIVISYGDFSGIHLADGYDYGDTGGASGDHESTWVNLDVDWLREDYAAGSEGWWLLNFTVPPTDGYWTGFHYATYARSFQDWGMDPQIQFWDFVGEQWVKFDDYENDWTWHNGTVLNTNYIGGDTVTMRGWIGAQGTYSGLLYCDYAELVFFDLGAWHELPPAQMWFDLPDWEWINDIDFIFPVPWSDEVQFGYDAFFIFLGLIMIPCSTMYLVKGGRKDMSTDKLFFGLILFFVGVAFLIGGIIP